MKTILPLIAVLAALMLMAGNSQDDGRSFFTINTASVNEVGSGYDSDGAGTSVYNSDGTGFFRLEVPVGCIVNSAYTDDGIWYQFGGFAGAGKVDGIITSTAVSEDNNVVMATTSTTGVELTLPPATDVSGKLLTFIKIDSDAGEITITPDGTDTIDGSASWTVANQYDTITLVSNGADGWLIVGTYTYAAP